MSLKEVQAIQHVLSVVMSRGVVIGVSLGQSTSSTTTTGVVRRESRLQVAFEVREVISKMTSRLFCISGNRQPTFTTRTVIPLPRAMSMTTISRLRLIARSQVSLS